jgi:hypothetical protein
MRIDARLAEANVPRILAADESVVEEEETMSQFIIEMGSANEHHNDIGYLRDMIDAVIDCDTGKHEVILKHQLFKHAPPNEPLEWEVFAWAYGYAWSKGYQTTASVFDVDALRFLERFRVPFVKVACRPKLYYLRHETELPCYISVYAGQKPVEGETCLGCVPKYPAKMIDYQTKTTDWGIPTNHWWIDPQYKGVSDHTVGWDLYNKYNPAIIEKHFCLKRSPDNPDSGPFAVDPSMLREVL